jgi:hypothetical protein
MDPESPPARGNLVTHIGHLMALTATLGSKFRFKAARVIRSGRRSVPPGEEPLMTTHAATRARAAGISSSRGGQGRRTALALALAATALGARESRAHHEAIFGPHSSLVLSAPAYASLQSYSRQTGAADARTQESTLLLSAGFTPVPELPLSFTLVAPVSDISPLDGQADAERGLEDLILGARYRLDLDALKNRFGKDGNYVLAMAALELPTGSIDHQAFQGPVDGMAALMGSVERGAFSAIGYGFYRRHGTDASGVRAGDNFYLGGGAAWTPWDDAATERLLSLQFGFSFEIYLRDRLHGRPDTATGGRGLHAHPTVVWGPGGHLLVFAMFTATLAQDFSNPAGQDRWRAGAGLIYLFH